MHEPFIGRARLTAVKQRVRRTFCAIIFSICALSVAQTSHAQTAQVAKFNAANGSLEASVTFETVGDLLYVHLENSSKNDSLVPRDLLTGVYFDIPGSPKLTPISAYLSDGSSMYHGIAPGGNVGGEWAFASDLTGTLNDSHYGISTAGLGWFGGKNMFPGPNLDGKPGVGGMNYALLSAGDNPSTGNRALKSTPLIMNGVDFVLKGMPEQFTLDAISNLSVQYGTSTSEPRFTVPNDFVVPEPASLARFAIPLALITRRRRKA